MDDIRTGKYRHFKGQDYWVMAVASHSETEEKLVIYRCLYGNYDWWVRPLDNFAATVEVNGEPVKRYEYIGQLTRSDEETLLKKGWALPASVVAALSEQATIDD